MEPHNLTISNEEENTITSQVAEYFKEPAKYKGFFLHAETWLPMLQVTMSCTKMSFFDSIT